MPPCWFLRVEFSLSVMSDPFRPHGLQHARPHCPSLTPRVDSNSCLLSRWCHPTISSSVVPFSSHLQSFPASGSFPMVLCLFSQFSSVTQLCLTLCDPMNRTQHTRPPCPSPTPRAYSNPCPLSQWCHPAIWSSVVPFSSCLQSLPASWSFLVSQLFIWGVKSTGVSASASVLPMNTQDWSPLGWTGWLSLFSKGLSKVFSNTAVQKHQFLGTQLSSQSNSHIHTWPLEKP